MADEALLAYQDTLLRIARDAIGYGLRHGEAPRLPLQDLAAELCEPRATFVTLELGHALRGCIGCLEAHQALAADVNHNAFAAAFHDPRFPRLRSDEARRLDIHISVLSLPEPLIVKSETELLAMLEPGIDGLILEDRGRRSTFLPAVWEQLPDARAFVQQLKRKAGWEDDYWTDTLVVKRYRTLSLPG